MIIRQISWGSPEYWTAVDLRSKILREPLGLQFTEEELQAEVDQIHWIATDGDQVLGCLAYVELTDEVLKMRQVAVDLDLQRGGVGRAMVEATEVWAKTKGYKEIVLHARAVVEPFYEKLGYETVGEPFDEVTIPHVKMRKLLN